MKIYKGFTLMELLVAIGIFAVIGTVVLSIFFITLRVSRKSDVLIALKQNGNIALAQVTKSIRFAKELKSPTSCVVPAVTTSIIISSVVDNGITKFSCEPGPPATIASNGASLLDTNTVRLTSCSFTCTQGNLNDPPVVNFSFVLKGLISSQTVESTGTIPFQTSILMRNFAR